MLALAACSAEAPEEIPCVSANGIEVFCGFVRPEDMVGTPDGRYLVVSEMGSDFGEAWKPGNLSFFDLETGQRTVADIRLEPTEGWGDASCSPPENAGISPHGIDIRELPSGEWQLAVVSHFPKEAIELFAIENWGGAPYLVWKGCLEAPEDAYLNDVTLTPDGDIFATHMFDRSRSELLLLPAFVFGMDTGYVWAWRPDSGFARVPGSDGGFPNGITSDASGDTLFVNYYTGSKTRALDSTTGEVKASFPVQHPDNIVYEDGNLYIASHDHELGGASVCEGRKTTCPLAYSIYRVNAETMQGQRIFSGTGAPFGVATVGLPQGKWLWLGSFLGDRIARVPLDG